MIRKKSVVNVYKRWNQALNEKQPLIDSVLQLTKIFFKKVENMLQINLWKKILCDFAPSSIQCDYLQEFENLSHQTTF